LTWSKKKDGLFDGPEDLEGGPRRWTYKVLSLCVIIKKHIYLYLIEFLVFYGYTSPVSSIVSGFSPLVFVIIDNRS